MRGRFSRSPAARACPQPRVQEEGNGLRNPRVAGHPATHRPVVHAQAPGSLRLAQAKAAEGIAELLRRHGHSLVRKVWAPRSRGKLPQPPSAHALSPRAICPRFGLRCPVIPQTRRRDTFSEPSGCWRSLRTTCGSPPRASWRATITLGWSWRHAAGCGLPRPSLSRGQRAVRFASFGRVCPSGGLFSAAPSGLPAGLWSYCGRPGGACEPSCDWYLFCERFDRNRIRAPRRIHD